VGFDIACGVRLLTSTMTRAQAAGRLGLMDDPDRRIPRGMGRGAVWRVGGAAELEKILLAGSVYAVEHVLAAHDEIAIGYCTEGQPHRAGHLPVDQRPTGLPRCAASTSMSSIVDNR
jgi:tRNA-splicing ligase RtcB